MTAALETGQSGHAQTAHVNAPGRVRASWGLISGLTELDVAGVHAAQHDGLHQHGGLKNNQGFQAGERGGRQ